MTVKLVVIYPRPGDIEAFETVYNRDHVPMAVAKLAGKTKIVASKIVGSPLVGHIELQGKNRITILSGQWRNRLQVAGRRRNPISAL